MAACASADPLPIRQPTTGNEGDRRHNLERNTGDRRHNLERRKYRVYALLPYLVFEVMAPVPLLPPVTELDAADMTAKLRAGQLLDGCRGAPPGAKNALIRAIPQISALVEVVAPVPIISLEVMAPVPIVAT